MKKFTHVEARDGERERVKERGTIARPELVHQKYVSLNVQVPKRGRKVKILHLKHWPDAEY